MANSDTDLENLNDEQLERRIKVLNVVKLQQDIMKLQQELQSSHEINMATIEKMRVENDKFRAETEKIQKETRFYPMLTLTMGISAIIGGIIASLITKLL